MRNYNHERIRKRRLKMGLSQTELARNAGISREHLIEIEKGRSLPKVDMLSRIAYALNVRESYFFAESVKNN